MTKTCKTRNLHIAESFDSFLREEGINESVRTTAIKRVLAMQLEEAMKQHKLTRIEMARRMRTSRVQLDRLLDMISTTSQTRAQNDSIEPTAVNCRWHLASHHLPCTPTVKVIPSFSA